MNLTWNKLSNLQVRVKGEDRRYGTPKIAFMNPETGQIIAYMVGITHVLAPVDISELRAKSIIIQDKSALVLPTELIRLQEFGLKHCLLNTKSVRSKSGKNLGRVQDFNISYLDHRVSQIFFAKRFLTFEWAQKSVSYQHIQEVTPSHVQLNIEPEEPIDNKKGQPLRATL